MNDIHPIQRSQYYHYKKTKINFAKILSSELNNDASANQKMDFFLIRTKKNEISPVKVDRVEPEINAHTRARAYTHIHTEIF